MADPLSIPLKLSLLQYFFYHLCHSRRVGFSFQRPHALSHERSESLLLATLIICDRLRIICKDFLYRLFDGSLIVHGLKSVLFHVFLRFYIIGKDLFENFSRDSGADGSRICHIDQFRQMLR